MDKIFLHQMHFYGYHGVYEEENRLGQRFIVDLELGTCVREASQTDCVDHTINYAEVYGLVKKEVEETCVKLVETLAENIAQRLLSAFTIQQVCVKVIKPDPPIPGYLDYVGVEIIRSASG